MKKISFLLFFALAVSGCTKDPIESPAPLDTFKQESTMIQLSDNMTVLGRKLENPYTVDNMIIANNNIASRGVITNINISVTHLYIRFLPRNTQEYYQMAKDDALDIYDHPLDYEIKQPGNTYHEPTIPNNQYSWQYCVVSPGYNFPNIQYEVLAELYIPQEIDNNSTNSSLDLLEDEAFRITGNTIDGQRVAAFTPSGTIKVRNTYQYRDYRDGITKSVDNMIGLEGIQVRANRWFKTYRAVTDVNGYYRMNDSFKNPCNYSIKWERPDFDILDRSILGQATLNGPKQSGDWNVDINSGSQLFYATIHRGAWDYYYNDNLRNLVGVKKPPTRDNSFQQRISLLAKDEDANVPNGDFANWRATFGFPHIRIFRSNRNSDEIYSTTIHELAHASHNEIHGWGFNGVDDVIIESWARAVQCYFTTRRFESYTQSPSYDWRDQYQTTENTVRNYTPLFIDLYDEYNQRQAFGGATNLYEDNVDGISPRIVEPLLSNTNTLADLNHNIYGIHGANEIEFFLQYQ